MKNYKIYEKKNNGLWKGNMNFVLDYDSISVNKMLVMKM